jgi:hypothetical protein
MESNSDILIESESLRIRIPKQNITDSELEISDSPNSLLSVGISYISDTSSIVESTGRNCPQFDHINELENKSFTPIKFIDENLTPTPPPPPPPKEHLDDSILPPPSLEENLTPTPPPPEEDSTPPSPEEDSTSSDENQAPVLNLYSLTSPNELRIQIQNVDQINEGIEPKINLLREIGSSILLITVTVLVSPVLIVILIMYFITKCFFS